MVCPRCGAVFEGNFCPYCGTAAAPQAPATPGYQGPCPRCGTVYAGNFCPRCGLPAVSAPYVPRPYPLGPSTGLHSFLSIIWIVSIAAVLVLVLLNVAALLISPTFVWPGIQGVTQGQIANQGLDGGSANWTFLDPFGSGSTGAYAPTGGDPNGFLQLDLPAGTNVGGLWEQAFHVTGSPPFIAQLSLDLQVQSSGSGPQGGELVVAIERVPQSLYVAGASGVVFYNGTMGWQGSPVIDVSNAISDPGTYYVKVAFLAASNPAPTVVGFDNLHLAWATDAYFYVVAPFPVPLLLYFSENPGQIAASYLFVLAAILIPIAYYTYRERGLLVRAFAAPLDAISLRLRSMSTWVAVAQAWLAVTFFQLSIVLALNALGSPATSPIQVTPTNTWFLLYDLARASVFEELAFRVLLIGLPMSIGALIFHAGRPSPSGGRPKLLGAFRYLLGGQLRATSSREALLAGWILLFASSAVFGLAHDASWGFWKVVPAAVAGLAFGYLFLRHGIGAAIVGHFLNDYLNAILMEGVGGVALEAVLGLLLWGLLVAGAGFFIWYLIYAWQHLQDLRVRFGAHLVRRAAPTGAAPPPPAWGPAPPPAGWTGTPPTYGSPPAPPPAAPPTTPPWSMPPTAASMPVRGGAHVPREYTPTYHPPPYGFPPVRFQCPACGWVEARYDGRRFTCLRCGRTT